MGCNKQEVIIDKDNKSITFYEFNSIYKKINLSDEGFVESIQTFKNNQLILNGLLTILTANLQMNFMEMAKLK